MKAVLPLYFLLFFMTFAFAIGVYLVWLFAEILHNTFTLNVFLPMLLVLTKSLPLLYIFVFAVEVIDAYFNPSGQKALANLIVFIFFGLLYYGFLNVSKYMIDTIFVNNEVNRVLFKDAFEFLLSDTLLYIMIITTILSFIFNLKSLSGANEI